MADSLFYLAEAINHRTSSAGDAENGDSDAESFYESDVDDFDDISINDPQEDLLGEASAARPKSPEAIHCHSTPSQIDYSSDDGMPDLPPIDNQQIGVATSPHDDDEAIPRGKSIAHNY